MAEQVMARCPLSTARLAMAQRSSPARRPQRPTCSVVASVTLARAFSKPGNDSLEHR